MSTTNAPVVTDLAPLAALIEATIADLNAAENCLALVLQGESDATLVKDGTSTATVALRHRWAALMDAWAALAGETAPWAGALPVPTMDLPAHRRVTLPEGLVLTYRTGVGFSLVGGCLHRASCSTLSEENPGVSRPTAVTLRVAKPRVCLRCLPRGTTVADLLAGTDALDALQPTS